MHLKSIFDEPYQIILRRTLSNYTTHWFFIFPLFFEDGPPWHRRLFSYTTHGFFHWLFHALLYWLCFPLLHSLLNSKCPHSIRYRSFTPLVCSWIFLPWLYLPFCSLSSLYFLALPGQMSFFAAVLGFMYSICLRMSVFAAGISLSTLASGCRYSLSLRIEIEDKGNCNNLSIDTTRNTQP